MIFYTVESLRRADIIYIYNSALSKSLTIDGTDQIICRAELDGGEEKRNVL